METGLEPPGFSPGEIQTTSIIKFITRRFELEPLPGVRANAGDLSGALDFEPH